MYNPLENFKNPWDADGEFAQSFLNLDKVLAIPLSQKNESSEEQPDDYPWRVWGIFFTDEQKAYKFMIDESKTLPKGTELASYVTQKGVFILPSIENGIEVVNRDLALVSYSFFDNRQENPPYKNNFYVGKYPNTNLQLKDPRYENLVKRWKKSELLDSLRVYAYVHTHPFNGVLNQVDKKLSVNMNVPIYALGLTEDGVVRYYFMHEEGILWNTSDIIEYASKSILTHAKILLH